MTTAFAVAWLVVLFIIAGCKDDTWYILAVGLVGTVQNVVASGVRRTPATLGIPLQRLQPEFSGTKVMHVLQTLDQSRPGVGASLVRFYHLIPPSTDHLPKPALAHYPRCPPKSTRACVEPEEGELQRLSGSSVRCRTVQINI